VAVCFNSPNVETYRQPDPGRHPGRGRLGPDLAATAADLEEATELLLAYPEPEARLRDVLLDQHVMVGVGNVYRSEVLWAIELSPWAHVGDLSPADATMIVNTTARMLRAGRSRAHPSRGSRGPAVFGRNGQGCLRCHATIESRAVGRAGRMLYWCPGCQVRLDRHLIEHLEIRREMDPHPAAARYLSDLPWRTRDAS